MSQSQSPDEEQEQAEEADAGPLANLLSLQLRKPPHWNWELSTSRSCSNIALPRILLYDHTGALLVDAHSGSEQTYRSTDPPQGQRESQRIRRKRSATSNLSGCLARDFHGLHIAEATPSPSRSRSREHSHMGSGSCIEINTHELPNWEPGSGSGWGSGSGSSRRSSSLRGVRFLESPKPLVEQEEEVEVELPVYPTPPSTSTTTMTTTTANSSSSGPREKRRYRRSHSSILERFSLSRGRHSSPEYAQEQDVERAPRYYLRTSKAGTLVIREESFSRMRQRRRRPPKHSSSENILQERSESAQSAVQVTTRRRHQEAAAAAAAAISTSEEEEQREEKPRHSHGRQSRGRRTQRSCIKDVAQELITVDPDNCVYRAAPGATAR
ncbi:GRB10-interacting GYF protein 2 [Drosophila miranda]|uniref:GRB10-interacting GYF protein 2 n=1 Tax=Drosophila miranda TaxID=7229 RepID=UPI0007E6A599|nr:GRB10-interacting GYF protein 2 [Drosophila miranda]